ncbi:hypothetical protein TEA_009345 [Camellia sinensis var. sinensis]|uniref:Uncharacterized protein n=1 Tax=Camellia sinensis var. sinensis TaxID=542762 RepID=A0A4V3WNW3_CAMSN|nr:hypothetical protein TEA_009345 [Camellia sinensis var. sinensis]
MGKTTLAQLVYNNEKVVKHFGDQRMWICVSNDFIVPKLLNQMVQSLTGDKSDIDNIEGIVRKLAAKLNGKKYLLVLDDVWNENPDKWECMRNSLVGIGGSKGSKIISTTRSMHVVSTMRTSPSLTHHLNQLSENESWTMFWKRAFANGGPTETSNLVAIGRKMVEKCKGVPLAIKSLGDFNIQKDKSIQLWMAQGYLQPSSGSNLEMKDVDVSKGNCLALASTASEANYHPEVQHLSFTLMGNVSFEISKENVGKLRTLFSEVKIDSPSTAEDTTSINHKDVLEGLKPHGNLRGLKLQNFEGKSFASWMMSSRDAQLLQNLVKIELSKCTRCEQVPPLGHLPHLEVIRMSGLSNLKCIGPEFYGCHSVVNHHQCNDGIITGSYSGAITTATEKAMAIVFPALRELHLKDMPNIEEWCVLGVSSLSSDTTMFFPLLEFVHISGCTELTIIPGDLLSLQELICNDKLDTRHPYLRIEVSRGSRIEPSTTVSAASATVTVEEEVDDDDTKYHLNPKHYPFIFLVSLTLFGWERPKYLPDQLQHLTTFRDFSLQHFCGLEALPEWLANLSSLHSLELFDCKNLMYLPTMEAM